MPVFKTSNYYVPLPKQKLFHESSAKYKCFMGGVGSGKTTALVWEAIFNSLETPNNYGLLGRYTYPELRDTTMHEFFQILPEEAIQSWVKTENKLVLKNGSTIIFRHLEEPDKLKSLNLGWFGIDEMTEIPEDVFLMLQSRLRRTNVGRRVGFGSTNPEGHDWVWHKWCVQHRHDDDYLFVKVASRENTYLPEDYVDDLIKSYPEHWVKRYVEGDPSAFSGQILTSWDEREHVIAPIDIPSDWKRIVCLDHGTNNPTAVLWCAIHPEGFKIIYKEHYESGQIIEHHAKKIYQLNGSDNVESWLADPAIFNRTLQDPKRGLHSVADEYAELGLHFIQGDNDVKSGINKLIDAFNVWPELVNPFTGKQGSPKIFITSNCEHTMFEVPQYKWKEFRIRGRYRAKPEEPEKSNDHAIDCIRYILMTDPRPHKAKTDRFKPFGDRNELVWNVIDKITKQHARLQRARTL